LNMKLLVVIALVNSMFHAAEALSRRSRALLTTSSKDEQSPRSLSKIARSPTLLRMTLKRRSSEWRTKLDAAVPPFFMQTRADIGTMSGARSSSLGSGAADTASPVDIYGQIAVGSPPQQFNVAIDTASSNMVLVSSECQDVGCFAHKSYNMKWSSTAEELEFNLSSATFPTIIRKGSATVSILMSTGQAEGEVVKDTVCLGDSKEICATTGFVAMTSMTQEPWNVFPYDGILGVGMPAGSVDKRFNFLGNIGEKGLLERNRFAIWLAMDSDTEESEITFGNFDEKRLGSEIVWVPTSRASTGMWQTILSDVTKDNVGLGLCGENGCQVAFDTGTSVIGGPTHLISGLLDKLDIQEDCSNYDSLPLLGFTFRMYILNLEKTDYVKRVGAKCLHQFLKIDLDPSKGELVLLGDPFMKRYLTIFDRDSLKIGLAFANHEQGPDTKETNEQIGKRLMHMTT